jgi:hypothetical protein
MAGINGPFEKESEGYCHDSDSARIPRRFSPGPATTKSFSRRMAAKAGSYKNKEKAQFAMRNSKIRTRPTKLNGQFKGHQDRV